MGGGLFRLQGLRDAERLPAGGPSPIVGSAPKQFTGDIVLVSSDTRLAQLLCSRLCHDLVGPAGAVNAGLELAEDGDLDVASLELINESAAAITGRLAFFRVAFGAGGGKMSAEGTLSLNEARALAGGLMAEGRVDLDWPDGSHAPDAFSAGVGKVLMLMVLVAADCLPRGGRVTVHTAALPEGIGLAVVAQGDNARLRQDLADGLAAGTADENVSARNVHAYFAQQLARQEDGQIEAVRESDREIRLMALFRKGYQA